MKLQTRPREEPEVNLTSLIDVVLLLLVFFMVSTSFLRETEIRLRLPEAEAVDREEEAQSPLEITVTADGGFLVDGREVINRRPDTLRRALVQAAGDDRARPVTIRADARTEHQAVVTAMDVAGRLGFTRINIATVHTPSAPSGD
jgi:biopolymer transport protein ExbD